MRTGMKRTGIGLALMVALGGAQAQQGGPGMTGDQGSKEMMGPRMMHQQSMRDMHRMMTRMQDMMGEMSRAMDRERQRLDSGDRDQLQLEDQDRERMQEMSRLMDQAGDSMKGMAQHMREGSMNEESREQMRQRMEEMERIMERIREEQQSS